MLLALLMPVPTRGAATMPLLPGCCMCISAGEARLGRGWKAGVSCAVGCGSVDTKSLQHTRLPLLGGPGGVLAMPGKPCPAGPLPPIKPRMGLAGGRPSGTAGRRLTAEPGPGVAAGGGMHQAVAAGGEPPPTASHH